MDRDVEVCHGTPFDEDTYVFDEAGAERALDAAHRQICFFGHTHVPVAYVRKGSDLTTVHLQQRLRDDRGEHPQEEPLSHQPGSIGQPRDTDPRASYAFLREKQRLEIRRVPYRVDLAQQRIVEVGLPESLAFRLGLGR